MRLFCKRYGAGRPVIILHGLFGSHINWYTISRKLEDRFSVFALDLRNHGDSPHSDAFDYDLMAEDVREFMEREKISRAAVIGHSMGGKVAMTLACSHSSRLEKLVVVDIAPKAYPDDKEGLLRTMTSLELDRLETIEQAVEELGAWIPSLPLRRFLVKNLKRKKGGGFKWRINLQAVVSCHGKIRSAPPLKEPFSGPALFIRGERSDYVGREDGESIRAWFPRAKILTIKKAGHWVHADMPDVFADQVRNFIG